MEEKDDWHIRAALGPDHRGIRVRGIISGLAGAAWLVFLLVWLFFFADGLSIYRNIAIIFLSIVLTMGVVGAIWASFGLGMAERAAPDLRERKGLRGIRWRSAATLLMWAAWAGALILWLYFMADRYTGYQNLALFIVSIIIAGAASAALWRMYMHRW